MKTSRREFLEAAAAAGTLAVVPAVRAAEDKRILRVGVIGVGCQVSPTTMPHFALNGLSGMFEYHSLHVVIISISR